LWNIPCTVHLPNARSGESVLCCMSEDDSTDTFAAPAGRWEDSSSRESHSQEERGEQGKLT
jgi:hypothetical protein